MEDKKDKSIKSPRSLRSSASDNKTPRSKTPDNKTSRPCTPDRDIQQIVNNIKAEMNNSIKTNPETTTLNCEVLNKLFAKLKPNNNAQSFTRIRFDKTISEEHKKILQQTVPMLSENNYIDFEGHKILSDEDIFILKNNGLVYTEIYRSPNY